MKVSTILLCVGLVLGVPVSGNAQSRFDEWDKNNDDKLTRGELPRNLRRNFDRADLNKDGWISREEDQKIRERSRAQNGTSKVAKETNVLRDIVYVSDGHQRHKLDLYLPAKGTTQGEAESHSVRPLVVWIHGGGWRNGDKRNCPAAFLVADGFVVASVNYRLSHHAIFPAQIEDCKAAIRWLRSNAGKYQIDPDRIGVWGSSAGGHLVALLGTSGDVAALEGKLGIQNVSSRVQAVCDYFGPTALAKMNEQAGALGKLDHDSVNSPESKLLGGALQEKLAEAKAASPLTYVSEDDPPFLIVHGDKDPLVPLQQSKDIDKMLSAAGVETTLIVVEGGGHGGFRESKYTDRVRDFFTKHLGKQ